MLNTRKEGTKSTEEKSRIQGLKEERRKRGKREGGTGGTRGGRWGIRSGVSANAIV